MRRLLLLTGAIVLVDTMFFAALTPLLPHYVHELHLGKAGAGVLQAMFPAGALVAGIPGGMAAARLGVKPTVLIGLSLLALTTLAFGLADSVWTLDLARFLQGISSAFSWTGALSWLVAAAPAGRRGQLIGSAFGAAIAGALFGPVLGAVASFTGTGPAFGAVAGLALVLAGAAAATPAPAPQRPQPLRTLFDCAPAQPDDPDRRLALPPPRALLRDPVRPRPLAPLGPRLGRSGGRRDLPRVGRRSKPPGRRCWDGSPTGTVAYRRFSVPWPPRPWSPCCCPGPARPCCSHSSWSARGFAFGSFWTPAMSLVTDAAEQSGLEYGYAFALVNVAWAPGQAGGSAIGGAVASATTDAVPYLGLTVLCLVTLAALMRYKEAAVPLAAER